jgi:hypothetical protein
LPREPSTPRAAVWCRLRWLADVRLADGTLLCRHDLADPVLWRITALVHEADVDGMHGSWRRKLLLGREPT